MLSLPLFVARVGFADDAQDTVAADDLTLLANAFDGGTNLHGWTPCSNLPTCPRVIRRLGWGGYLTSAARRIAANILVQPA
jgi:hypothetical protein